jgi:hypothetical protein
VAGLAAAGTAAGLAGTARVTAHGIAIPALHDAASDRPVAYTPVCTRSAVPVCLHPAYRAYLPEVTAALGPVLGQLAGLPGAPVRVTQVAVTSVQSERENGIGFGGPAIGGRPPVLYLPLSGVSLPGEGNTSAAQFTSDLRQQYGPQIVNDLIGLPSGAAVGTGVTSINVAPGARAAAQIAVARALDQIMGLTQIGGGSPARSGAGSGVSPLARQEAAASRRFSALPAAARHAWLAAHLAALRAGRITLSEIP